MASSATGPRHGVRSAAQGRKITLFITLVLVVSQLSLGAHFCTWVHTPWRALRALQPVRTCPPGSHRLVSVGDGVVPHAGCPLAQRRGYRCRPRPRVGRRPLLERPR